MKQLIKKGEKQNPSHCSPKLVASNWLYFTLYLTCQGQSLSFIFLKPQRSFSGSCVAISKLEKIIGSCGNLWKENIFLDFLLKAGD